MKRTLALTLLFASSFASAHPARHLVCHEEIRVEAKPRAKPRTEADDWTPLPRRRPPRLGLAKLEVFDVPESDPMPSRRVVGPRPAAPEPVEVRIESRNDYLCIGVPRGTPGILRAISAPPGTRVWGHPYLESWRQDNMQAAGLLDIGQAKSALRRELDRPMPKGIEAWQEGELTRTKHFAARALADLGDSASAPRVLALLRALERDGFNLWRDTLDALPRLDPALAQSYAVELLRRALDDPAFLQKNSQLYTDLLPLLVTPSADALAVLRRASAGITRDDVSLPGGAGGACEVLATRLRLGDKELERELRGELNTASIDTQRGVACYSTLMPELYPGRDASELDVLMYRHRYQAILAWLEATHASGGEAAARQKLLGWLRKRSSEPDVAGDRSLRAFIPDKRAMHLAALAELGDAPARKLLSALVTDAKDDGTAPWIAAYWALRFELPGAADQAARRLGIAMQQHMRRFSSESWPERGVLKITEQGRVVEELVRRGDDRFVLGLLSEDGFTRELSRSWLAKKRPAGACSLVGAAARNASSDAVDEAFWALSVLGDRCRASMKQLVADPKQPPFVRGMANEHLAMLRDPAVPANDAALARDQRLSASLERARIIFADPE